MKQAVLLLAGLSIIELSAVEFIGIIKPIDNVKISVPLDGKVEKLFVKEGSTVKKGSKLLQLDNQLQALECKRREIIWRDKAQLNAAVQTKKIKKSLLTSTKELYTQSKAVSKQEVQMLESQYFKLLGEIKMRQENEKKEHLEYKIAKQLLKQYTVNSPVNGIVTKISLQEGEWTRMGDATIQIVNADRCFVDINIDEKYSSTLKVGNKINFKVETKNVSTNKIGKIGFISPMADMASGLVRIKIEFSNVENYITPGLSAKININTFADVK